MKEAQDRIKLGLREVQERMRSAEQIADPAERQHVLDECRLETRNLIADAAAQSLHNSRMKEAQDRIKLGFREVQERMRSAEQITDPAERQHVLDECRLETRNLITDAAAQSLAHKKATTTTTNPASVANSTPPPPNVVHDGPKEFTYESCEKHLRECLRSMLGAMWKTDPEPHLMLLLDPEWKGYHASHGKIQSPRQRPAYRSGGVSSITDHCEAVSLHLEERVTHAKDELYELLLEIRKADLELKGFAPASKPPVSKVDQVLGVLRDMLGRQAIETLEELTEGKHKQEELSVEERDLDALQQLQQKLSKLERLICRAHTSLEEDAQDKTGRLQVTGSLKRRLTRTARAAAGLLILYVFLGIIALGMTDTDMEDMRSACDLAADNAREDCSIAPTLWEEMGIVGIECDQGEVAAYSWQFVGALVPLTAQALLTPLALFTGNLHKEVFIHLFVWTPSVPLIILQLLLRTCILTRIAADASDSDYVYATIYAIEAWCLLFQVITFITMDAMVCQTPRLKGFFAFAHGVRFGGSFFVRTLSLQASEQCHTMFSPLFGSTRQDSIASLDFAVGNLLIAALISCLFEPSKMAFGGIRCTVKEYYSWRLHFQKLLKVRMLVRGERFGEMMSHMHMCPLKEAPRQTDREAAGAEAVASRVVEAGIAEGSRRAEGRGEVLVEAAVPELEVVPQDLPSPPSRTRSALP